MIHVFQAAFLAMKPTGGKLFIFQSGKLFSPFIFLVKASMQIDCIFVASSISQLFFLQKFLMHFLTGWSSL